MRKGEIWKKIPLEELPAYYEVSNFGQLRSLPYIDKRGWRRKLYYFTFQDAEVALTTHEGKSRCYPVAALVLRAFVGPPKQGQYLARHLDDNRKNNKLDNLAWGTDADNHVDAVKNGANFASYGHAGKHHTEKTKQILRDKRLGKPTGHKMTPEHKAALLAGYRNKFPVKANTDGKQ